MADKTPSPIGAPVDFLIVTALPEERDAVLDKIGPYQKVQLPGSPTYYLASLATCLPDVCYQVAVTMLSEMGNVESAQHTKQAIADLDPAYVVMTGIAGGIKGQVKLGDIVVAKQILYYEQAKQKPSGSDLRPQAYPGDAMLLERAQNYTDAT